MGSATSIKEAANFQRTKNCRFDSPTKDYHEESQSQSKFPYVIWNDSVTGV